MTVLRRQRAVEAPPATPQPDLADLLRTGSLVEIVWWDGSRTRHRAYEVHSDGVVVSVARDCPDRPLLLRWSSERGEHQVEVGAEALPADAEEWWLDATSAVHTSQRRRFARADAAVPVVVGTEHGVAHGRTVDIGEGGLCCVVQKGPLPAPGEQVRVMMTADGVDCLVPALVVRVLPNDNGRPAFAVRFLEPVGDDRWLRRQVLRWQVAARKAVGPR